MRPLPHPIDSCPPVGRPTPSPADAVRIAAYAKALAAEARAIERSENVTGGEVADEDLGTTDPVETNADVITTI